MDRPLTAPATWPDHGQKSGRHHSFDAAKLTSHSETLNNVNAVPLRNTYTEVANTLAPDVPDTDLP